MASAIALLSSPPAMGVKGQGQGVCVCVCVCVLLNGVIPAQVAMSNIAVSYHRFRDGHV